jgi:hypothetical protein
MENRDRAAQRATLAAPVRHAAHTGFSVRIAMGLGINWPTSAKCEKYSSILASQP